MNATKNYKLKNEEAEEEAKNEPIAAANPTAQDETKP